MDLLLLGVFCLNNNNTLGRKCRKLACLNEFRRILGLFIRYLNDLIFFLKCSLHRLILPLFWWICLTAWAFGLNLLRLQILKRFVWTFLPSFQSFTWWIWPILLFIWLRLMSLGLVYICVLIWLWLIFIRLFLHWLFYPFLLVDRISQRCFFVFTN